MQFVVLDSPVSKEIMLVWIKYESLFHLLVGFHLPNFNFFCIVYISSLSGYGETLDIIELSGCLLNGIKKLGCPFL